VTGRVGRRQIPLWLLLIVFLVSLLGKGLVSGFNLLQTIAGMVFGIAVVALIFGLAFVVERRLNR
jgi:prepilin signal peptidase PulO-like enzyme (type II secretory pathway)